MLLAFYGLFSFGSGTTGLDDAPENLPLKIIDMAGREVEIPDEINSVVSCLPPRPPTPPPGQGEPDNRGRC